MLINIKALLNNPWTISIVSALCVSFVIFLLKITHHCFLKHKIYKWLKENTEDQVGKQFRSTKAIAKGTGIKLEKVDTICQIHPKVYQNKRKEGYWGLFGENEKSVYEERGIKTI